MYIPWNELTSKEYSLSFLVQNLSYTTVMLDVPVSTIYNG